MINCQFIIHPSPFTLHPTATVPLLLGISVALLVLALWFALRSGRRRRRTGLPSGELVYADTGDWSAVAQPYFSPRHRLTGKPDYLVETVEGPIPVEVKRTTAPGSGQAYPSHIMQLAAYCLLVEEAHGQAPPYGLIHYVDATVRIDYTPVLRDHLVDLLAEIRQDRRQPEVGRNHQDPARCRACGVGHACGRHALS